MSILLKNLTSKLFEISLFPISRLFRWHIYYFGSDSSLHANELHMQDPCPIETEHMKGPTLIQEEVSKKLSEPSYSKTTNKQTTNTSNKNYRGMNF